MVVVEVEVKEKKKEKEKEKRRGSGIGIGGFWFWWTVTLVCLVEAERTSNGVVGNLVPLLICKELVQLSVTLVTHASRSRQ